MKHTKKIFVLSIMFFFTFLLIIFFKQNPLLLEEFYSTGFNKKTIELLSTLSGQLSFSVHEILLILLVGSLLIYTIKTIRKLYLIKEKRKQIIASFLLKIVIVFSVTFLLFQALWGFNYYRTPFERELFLTKDEYSLQDLLELYSYLAEEANDLRTKVEEDKNGIMTINESGKNLLKRAPLGYTNAANDYKEIGGKYHHPKPILLSPLLSYTGITGVYSPFTGEANVNIHIPKMSIPVTAMHELAHQRGFASEDEANFIAFLTCTYHPDVDYQYSGYLLALSYTGNEIYSLDEEAYQEVKNLLSQDILNDMSVKYEYWEKHEGLIERFSNKVNDTYLKANGVSEGVESYSLVVQYLLGYYQHINKN